MPELPEVESIATRLRQGTHEQPSLLGQPIVAGQVLWELAVASPAPTEFLARIRSQVIQQIGRRGKFLVFRLSPDTLLFHLRMSGDLLIEGRSAPLAAHHRLTLDLGDGRRLAFNDPRKFGRAWLVGDPQEILGELGPEPLDPALTAEEFGRRLSAHRRQLKPLLMDQRFLAGLGNIYADEALHHAHLHPLTQASRLSASQGERLLQGIRQVLQEGIRRNGASIDWAYRGGEFQNYFRVYGRAGEPCLECGAPIQRIVVGQRGTHFCPACQPGP